MSEDCALGCENPVNPHDLGTWKEVTGFVGGEKSDSMRLRKDTGRYAHGACVAKIMEGQSIDQPTLFGDDDENTTGTVGESRSDSSGSGGSGSAGFPDLS